MEAPGRRQGQEPATAICSTHFDEAQKVGERTLRVAGGRCTYAINLISSVAAASPRMYSVGEHLPFRRPSCSSAAHFIK